jgi:Flp pilus assembly protein TadB
VNINVLIGIFAIGIAGISGAFFLYQYFFSNPEVDYRVLFGKPTPTKGQPFQAGFESTTRAPVDKNNLNDPFKLSEEGAEGEELQKLKDLTRKGGRRRQKISQDELYFQAGMFSNEEKVKFQRFRTTILIAMPIAGAVMAYFQIHTIDWAVIGGLLGVALGYQLPNSVVDRRIQSRQEDVMFYLPLVIEQISIGVSSSLDVGPCIERVVTMADERDTHNVVTELLQHVQYYMKSGVSFQDAMTEIAKKSGNTELKHAFMSLAQVARHGGEISRQLQELADAVAMQRETKVEEKIKKLELAATGPVACVFVGFMVILLVGFGLQIMKAFN